MYGMVSAIIMSMTNCIYGVLNTISIINIIKKFFFSQSFSIFVIAFGDVTCQLHGTLAVLLLQC